MGSRGRLSESFGFEPTPIKHLDRRLGPLDQAIAAQLINCPGDHLSHRSDRVCKTLLCGFDFGGGSAGGVYCFRSPVEVLCEPCFDAAKSANHQGPISASEPFGVFVHEGHRELGMSLRQELQVTGPELEHGSLLQRLGCVADVHRGKPNRSKALAPQDVPDGELASIRSCEVYPLQA